MITVDISTSPLTGYDQQITKGLGGWVIFPSTCCGNEGKQRNDRNEVQNGNGKDTGNFRLDKFNYVM